MRARSLKPGFFENEELGAVSFEARLLFAGLWCYADREGRFEWRPQRIKALIFPYDSVKINKILSQLEEKGFIQKYSVDKTYFGCIPTFSKHQNPHPHEAKSRIPVPMSEFEQSQNIEENQCHDMSLLVTKCNADSLFSDSLTPSSLTPGLNTLAPSPKNGSDPEAPSQPTETFILIPTNRADIEYPVTLPQVREFESLYPAVDVRQELREMRAWSITHNSQRKTYGGMPKFMNGWLSREQDRGGNSKRDSPQTAFTAKGLHNVQVAKDYLKTRGVICKTSNDSPKN